MQRPTFDAPKWLDLEYTENYHIEQLSKAYRNLKDKIVEQAEEIVSLREIVSAVNDKVQNGQDAEFYAWSPYEENHLETLAVDVPVLIPAGWLRQLLAHERKACVEEIERLREALEEAQQANRQLSIDFACYKDTAEEISQCYNDAHSDSWVFEEALRLIRKPAEEGKQDAYSENHAAIRHLADWMQGTAKQALEKVWRRREERARQALQGGDPQSTDGAQL